MAEYDISLSNNLKVNYSPDTKTEILQNVAMIFSSVANTCPMARDFAWNGSVLDRPVNLIQPLFTAQMVSALKKYEPRATLANLVPIVDKEGTTSWTAKVKINE